MTAIWHKHKDREREGGQEGGMTECRGSVKKSQIAARWGIRTEGVAVKRHVSGGKILELCCVSTSCQSQLPAPCDGCDSGPVAGCLSLIRGVDCHLIGQNGFPDRPRKTNMAMNPVRLSVK